MDAKRYGTLGVLLTVVGIGLGTIFGGTYPLPRVGLAFAVVGTTVLLAVVVASILDRYAGS